MPIFRRSLVFCAAMLGLAGASAADPLKTCFLYSNPIGESYHPNTTGHSSGYAPLVRAVMG